MLKAVHKQVQFSFLTALLIIPTIIAGCATPVGVKKLDPKAVQRTLTANVLTNGTVSPFTAQILNRFGLTKEFQSNPTQVIAKIHKGLAGVSESDRLFALAELSFCYAAQSHDRSHYLAAACYAYAFLYPGDHQGAPESVDPRYRTAVDLYNRSIAEGLTAPDSDEVVLKTGAYKVPFGTLNLYLNEAELQWGAYRLVRFEQAAELGVRGLRNRYRWPGIGAPLTASVEPREGAHSDAYSLVVPNIKVPVTVFLRLEDITAGLKSGTVQGHLDLHTIEKTTTVTINGNQIPLEFEQSSALAYTLEGSEMYNFELKGLLSGDFSLPIKNVARFRDDLFFIAPYVPGRIPVVLVHGTASSPARWAEMVNELQNDPVLWGRYQFWLFTYNSGNPILYSGGILAEALRTVVEKLDPEGKDPALKKMVVIGHSQGGLLTRLMVTDSGTKFWDDISSMPFEQLQAKPETKTIIQRSMFYTPLPFVQRVVFIATPHQGSFVSGGLIGQLAGKLISLPFKVLNPVQEVLVQNPQALAFRSMKDIPRSTDNMNPKNQFIKTLATMPIATGVTAHSIIAVDNPDDPKEKWNDGLVAYRSAHLDGVASELIVYSGHSTQSEPQTIEEVRRILLENLK
jgi:triacylglycerol esterase/lipase EstA (alpha/beta hydrolase family)